MPTLEELNDKIRVAEQRLVSLAQQNISYNSEIVRLRNAQSDAEIKTSGAINTLASIEKNIQSSSMELSSINAKIDDRKMILYELIAQHGISVSNCQKELSCLKSDISKLTDIRNALQEDVDKLSKQSFDAGVNLNTQKFSIDENSRKISSMKDQIASLDGELERITNSSDAISRKAKQDIDALNARAEDLSASVSDLERTIVDKKKELSAIESDSIRIKSEADSYDRSKRDEINAIITTIESQKKQNDDDAKANIILRQSLADREQELKLLELKIKELARKKDIDAQILQLSK